jgi:hypothetical protein
LGSFEGGPIISDTVIGETVALPPVQELLDHASKDENFLKRIITCDETWVYVYDVEMKMQSSQ